MQNLKNTFAGFWKYRYLLQNLISRDFKLKYRRSVLGVAWSVLNPLLTCLVMWAVFGALFNVRGQGIEDFPLFLIIGQLMFNFFRESTTMAMESVLKNGPLLRKVYIPKYIFPLEKCCFALVNFFFSLVALFIVALLTWSHISIGTVLLAVYPIVMLFIFSLGIGLILSTMYVFVRDIMHIWEVFCTLLVYGSAIFYDPRQMESWMQFVINLNPIYWYITSVRSCVMWGEGLTANMLLIPFLCAALSLGLGIFVFKKNQDKFVLYMYGGIEMAEQKPIISIDHVSMRFNLAKEKHESLKEYFVALLHGGVRFDEFFALDDVSFDIMPGDFYGLIGLNGSGKSTLLKVISGVYKPSAGSVTVNGTIAPLIELGAGFDMDLTARENIYLNGTVLGYTPKYIDSKFDEIVDFSELQDFLDVPLKNYSSGMVARLAFAVATMTKPDILIADEILSVGDFLFQEKCEKRMAELLSGGTTVILVSHSIDQIERMCNKVAWLDHGHLRRIGATKEITAEYRKFEKKDAMPAKVTEE